MDYKERRIHGEEGLPLSMYDQTAQSPRYHMSCHWHPEHEIVYVKSGVLELRLGVGDESILMKKALVTAVMTMMEMCIPAGVFPLWMIFATSSWYFSGLSSLYFSR